MGPVKVFVKRSRRRSGEGGRPGASGLCGKYRDNKFNKSFRNSDYLFLSSHYLHHWQEINPNLTKSRNHRNMNENLPIYLVYEKRIFVIHLGIIDEWFVVDRSGWDQSRCSCSWVIQISLHCSVYYLQIFIYTSD